MKLANAIGIISKKDDYMTALEAVTGEKTEFTPEEAGKLLEIYQENSNVKFGFTDETLVKAMLALDVPGANLLEPADASALAAMAEMCKVWTPKAKKIKAVKDAALAGDVSRPLALSMVRAALDAYAEQPNISAYQEEIHTLAGFLTQAEEAEFADASAFLLRVRERVR